MKIIPFPQPVEFNRIIELMDLVNEIYETEEHDFWEEGHVRTNEDELMQLAEEDRLLLAVEDDQIIGSIALDFHSPDLAEFKMLICDPSYRGKGIGSNLIAQAERHAQQKGIHHMQLVLVSPLEGEHSGKNLLRQWYQDLGYSITKNQSLTQSIPHLSKVAVMPLKCEIMSKSLR